MGTVAFFDLDRTLLDVNSGNLWIKRERQRGNLNNRALFRALVYSGMYALGYGKLDAALNEAASVYKGFPVEKMACIVRRWWEQDLEQRVRPAARTVLQAHREAGDRLVLATTNSQFAAEEAVRSLGMDDFVATRFEVVDGALTGTLTDNAFGEGKLHLCRHWAEQNGFDLAEAVFYTDSHSDVPLLKAVGKPVCVHPDRRLARLARELGWELQDWSAEQAVPVAV